MTILSIRHPIAIGLLLASSGSALAQSAASNVTIYGTVDQYLGYMRSSTGKSLWALNDGAILRSRIGLKGYEDLGGGYAATFTLENGFSGDTGGFADSTRLFDRQSWVGIKTPAAGEFRIGRQNSVPFFIGGAIDYTERTTYGSIINTFGVPSRFDNDLSWKSPRWAGFQFDVHYAMPETAGEGLGRRGVYQFGLDYTNGAYRAGYAGLMAKPNAGGQYDNAVQYHNAYFNYDYGPGKVYLAWVRSNNSTANANGNNAATILNNVSNPNNFFAGNDANIQRFYNVYQVSADYRLTPQLRIGALYGVMVDTSHKDGGAQGGNVGAYYDLSKRTTLYGFANYMKNQANAGWRFSGSAGPGSNLAGADINGKSLIGLQMGILHRF